MKGKFPPRGKELPYNYDPSLISGKIHMYIVLMTHKDEAMMMAMKEGIKKQFPNMKFTTQEYENRGIQLRLEGTHDETKPNMFALGFASAWTMIHEAQAMIDEQLKTNKEKKT